MRENGKRGNWGKDNNTKSNLKKTIWKPTIIKLTKMYRYINRNLYGVTK